MLELLKDDLQDKPLTLSSLCSSLPRPSVTGGIKGQVGVDILFLHGLWSEIENRNRKLCVLIRLGEIPYFHSL